MNAELNHRLLGLERRLRLTQGLCLAACLLALVGWAAPGLSQGQTLKVTKVSAPFQVVDSSGRLLMIVESGKPGPYLQLFDSAGRPSVVAGMGERGGGSLQVSDRTGKPGVVLAAEAKAGGSLKVLDGNGKPIFAKP